MRVNVIITLSEDSLVNIDKTLRILMEKGLSITKVYGFGVVSGSIYAKDFKNIDKLPEVISITKDNIVNIAPPESNIQ
jgi:hypothetical protein